MAAVFTTAIRVLTFRASREELVALDRRHLIFGLVCTWIVGVGRWWDDPGAHALQLLGLGSVIYVFVLSAFLWCLIRPLGSHGFSYQRVLIYVTLTSPPAIIYALPVERWLDLETARYVNAWFLAVVAAWRVGLWLAFLIRVPQFRWFRLTIALLFPLCFVVFALTVLNLERVVFDIMSGIREEDASPNDYAYLVLFNLTLLAYLTFIPLLLSYIVLVLINLAPRGNPFVAPDPTRES